MNTVAIFPNFDIGQNSTTRCVGSPPVPRLLAVPGPGAADAVVVVVQQAAPHHHPALGPAPGPAPRPRQGEGVGPGQHAQRQPRHGGHRGEAAGERGISIGLIKN